MLRPCSHARQPDETLSLLTRLSQKPGVQSTLILSRDNGAIVRASGLVSNTAAANPNSALPPPVEPAPADGYVAAAPTGRKDAATAAAAGVTATGMHSAEDVARMVWAFVSAAGSLAQGLALDDEVKLLRLRTKKNEVVIVPGTARQLLPVPLAMADATQMPNFCWW